MHSIRNTYYLPAGEKKAARATRADALSIRNAKNAEGKWLAGPTDEPNMTHFKQANDAAVMVILDTIKDPKLNNELAQLHDRYDDASDSQRTAMMMIMRLSEKIDSKDFVYKFLYLIEFIDWQQPRNMSHVDYVEEYTDKKDRLIAAYTENNSINYERLVNDLLTALMYDKLEPRLRKTLSKFINGWEAADFNMEKVGEWIERSTAFNDAESGIATRRAANDIAAVINELSDSDSDEESLAHRAYLMGNRPAKCSICGGPHYMSEHPGPCPLHQPPPNGLGCPGNGATGVPHMDGCRFKYVKPSDRKKARQPSKQGGLPRRAQASLLAADAPTGQPAVPPVAPATAPPPETAPTNNSAMAAIQRYADEEMSWRAKSLSVADPAQRQAYVEQANRVAEIRESMQAMLVTETAHQGLHDP